jgi:hypothetical protein
MGAHRALAEQRRPSACFLRTLGRWAVVNCFFRRVSQRRRNTHALLAFDRSTGLTRGLCAMSGCAERWSPHNAVAWAPDQSRRMNVEMRLLLLQEGLLRRRDLPHRNEAGVAMEGRPSQPQTKSKRRRT